MHGIRAPSPTIIKQTMTPYFRPHVFMYFFLIRTCFASSSHTYVCTSQVGISQGPREIRLAQTGASLQPETLASAGTK